MARTVAAKQMRRHDEVKGQKPWSPYRPQRENFIGIDGEGSEVLKLMASLVEDSKNTDTWWEISNQTGLSSATLAKIKNRLTGNPNFTTIMMIFAAFGYQISMNKKKRG